MLKSYWVVGGGGLQDFSVSPRPLGFGFWGLGLRGLGPGLDKNRRHQTKAWFLLATLNKL